MVNKTNPGLIILIGLPGSGKTHFAMQFASKNDFVHVNSDRVRSRHFQNPKFTTEERARVYKKIREVVTHHLLASERVILDSNLLTNKIRKDAYKYYARYSNKILFVQIDVDPKLAYKRATSRQETNDKFYHPMPPERAERMHHEFEKISEPLPHIIVSGYLDYGDKEKVVLAALKNISVK